MSGILVRGYAAPIRQPELWDGQMVYFDDSCFDGAIKNSRARLNFFDHESELFGEGLEFFADEYGLGFEAVIDAEMWRFLQPHMVTNSQFCSVRARGLRKDRVDVNGSAMDRVYAVDRIEHVTICDRPVFSGTAAWPDPSFIVGRLPHRLSLMNERWERGHAENTRRAATQRRFVAHVAELRRNRAARTLVSNFQVRSGERTRDIPLNGEIVKAMAHAMKSGTINAIGALGLSRHYWNAAERLAGVTK